MCKEILEGWCVMALSQLHLPYLPMRMYAWGSRNCSLKRLGILKVYEMFKWNEKKAHALMRDMFNRVLQNGMPYECRTNLMKSLGNVNN